MASLPADHFGRNLLRRRKQVGLSRNELGKLTELHRVDIGAIERGERLPRLDTILKVSACVKASPCELVAGLRWRAGYFVEGEFYLEKSPAADEEAGGA